MTNVADAMNLITMIKSLLNAHPVPLGLKVPWAQEVLKVLKVLKVTKTT